MNWKDKIKTAAVAIATTIMTSCSFSGNKKDALEPNERPTTEEAKGDAQQNLFDIVPENGTISFEDAQEIVKKSNGPDASKKLAAQLQAAGIPLTKSGENGQDSILYSVQRINEGGYDNPVWVLKNPKYALNKKIGNTEKVDNIEVKRKDQETYKLDESSIGIKEVSSEIISQEITRARILKLKNSTLQSLNAGDTIMVGNVPAVVKEKGKFPVIEEKQIKDTKVDTYIFDYVKAPTSRR